MAAQLLLGPMLRHVTETSATIFVETDAACRVEVAGTATRTFRVAGHHYALVVLEDLEPASVIEYDVRLDGARCWPADDSPFPPSCIRTLGRGGPVRVLFGSCRAAAPHLPPWTLSSTAHPEGRGVDALRAHGIRMLSQEREDWPDVLVLMGDQVYADEPSPRTRAKVSRARRDGRPSGVVGGFEHYTWLYRESWTPDVERWLFSVLPSTMIFDDHDMIDDWNISASWVREIRREAWWEEHVLGALVSYWIYQHLGNLSPHDLREEKLLEQAQLAEDATDLLWEWARASERATPVAGGYRFSYSRDIGRTRLVVVDCRNGRVLEPYRAMVDDDEWAWVEDRCAGDVDHLLLVASLPALVPEGLHHLQVWNAALCDGAWGRVVAWASERIRRALDLEDWAAFEASLVRLVRLLESVARGERRPDEHAPALVAVLSGDIHFSYVARLDVPGAVSRVHQIVGSPIRNSLTRRDRRVLRMATGRAGTWIGRALARATPGRHLDVTWEMTHGPEFANEMGLLHLDGDDATLVFERARHDDEGHDVLETVVRASL